MNQARAQHGVRPAPRRPPARGGAPAPSPLDAPDAAPSRTATSRAPRRSRARGPSSARTSPGAGSRGPAQFVQIWMNSPSHRANLLRPGFQRVGAGVSVGTFRGYAARRRDCELRETVVAAGFLLHRKSVGLSGLFLHQAASSSSFSRRSCVALAALDAREQVAHERRELERVERLRDVVDRRRCRARARGRGTRRGRSGTRSGSRPCARRRRAPRPPASRRAPASSRRGGSRRASRRGPSRAPSGRPPPRAPPCPRPRG